MVQVNKTDPVETARKILRERYPAALVGFVAGSFNRGEATAFSDIDLVIVFDHLEFAWRESFMLDYWPVEVFAHDPETLRYFVREVDGADGVQSLASMIVEGVRITENAPFAESIASMADEILREPAPAWSADEFLHQRYAINDLIDDLRDPRNLFEARITIGTLHERLGNFYFRSQRLWSASNKHIPRRMAKTNAEMADLWVHAYDEAYAGKYASLIALAESILAPYGGFLFDGYRRNAPSSWRLP